MLNIRYVAGVSWPRSGHHLVQRLLQEYFGPDFVYCEFYDPELDCCRVFPCTRSRVHFSKNHDRDLSGVMTAGLPYLIQYRSAAAAAVSDFELHLRDGHSDTAREFETFALHRARRWGKFVSKWVDGSDGLERLIVRYEHLTEDPLGTMAPIIQFFSPDVAVDRDKLTHTIATIPAIQITKIDEQWIEKAGVQSPRQVEDFRFYDLDLFRRIETVAQKSRRTAATASSMRVSGVSIDRIFPARIQFKDTLIRALAALAVPIGKGRASALRKLRRLVSGK